MKKVLLICLLMLMITIPGAAQDPEWQLDFFEDLAHGDLRVPNARQDGFHDLRIGLIQFRRLFEYIRRDMLSVRDMGRDPPGQLGVCPGHVLKKHVLPL